MLLEILLSLVLSFSLFGVMTLWAIATDVRDRHHARKAGTTPPHPALGTLLTTCMVSILRSLRKPKASPAAASDAPKPAPSPRTPTTEPAWWEQRP